MSRIIGDVFQISNGNVGLGTDTPVNKLHVVGDSYLNGTVTTNNNNINAGNGTITATTFSGTATQVSSTLTRGTYLTGSDFNGASATTWAVDATTAATANKIVARDGFGNIYAANVGIGTTVARALLDVQGGNAYISGNLGIANLNPTYQLDVTGDINFTGNLLQNGALVSFGGGGSSQWSSNLDNDLYYTSGNVGIGTTRALYKLHVEGNSYLNGTITTNNNNINAGSGTITATTFSGTATQVSSTLTRGTYLTGNNYNGASATTWAVDADTAATASKIVARDASSYIYASGVGIGTTVARALLDVQGGQAIISGNVGIGTNITTARLHILKTETTGDIVRVDDQASDTTPFIINNDGNVGIGTNIAVVALSVGGGGTDVTSTIMFNSGDTATNTDKLYWTFVKNGSRIGHSGGWNVNHYAGQLATAGSTNGNFHFFTGATPDYNERFTILNNGNVGIGSTAPSQRLDVAGGALINGTITTNNNNINAGTGTITATTFSGTATQVSSTLTRGTYLTGNNYNGASATTWAVDADSANTASKVVVRDASGNFSAGTITATLSGTATQVSSTLTRGSYLTGSDYNGASATTWAVDATTAATASKIVARDASGDIYANHIGIGTATARQLLDVEGGNIYVSGNIGIGTFTNPTYRLHVAGDMLITGQITASNLSVIGDYTIMDTISSNTEQMVITNDGTGPALKVTQTGPQPIADFYDDNNVLALRVADGGNVGIGTTNPTQKLYVDGGLFASSIQIGNVTYAHVPTGIIVLWSGSTGTIPTGWAICDGTNGTPDLRDRFIVGAGSTYSVAATGGANTVTLSTANLPDHVHTGTTNTTGSHTHNYDKSDTRGNIQGGGNINVGAVNYTSTATSSAGSHSHTVTTDATTGANSTPFSILPPYYALAYIMKL